MGNGASTKKNPSQRQANQYDDNFSDPDGVDLADDQYDDDLNQESGQVTPHSSYYNQHSGQRPMNQSANTASKNMQNSSPTKSRQTQSQTKNQYPNDYNTSNANQQNQQYSSGMNQSNSQAMYGSTKNNPKEVRTQNMPEIEEDDEPDNESQNGVRFKAVDLNNVPLVQPFVKQVFSKIPYPITESEIKKTRVIAEKFQFTLNTNGIISSYQNNSFSNICS